MTPFEVVIVAVVILFSVWGRAILTRGAGRWGERL
jgi:hypothetical protein